jgi:hypothetical protein
MAAKASASMSCHSTDRPLDDYQFTFESYLDDSVRIEPDVCAISLTRGMDEQRLTDTLASRVHMVYST